MIYKLELTLETDEDEMFGEEDLPTIKEFFQDNLGLETLTAKITKEEDSN